MGKRVAIGCYSGISSQYGVAIGMNAGKENQGDHSVAIGMNAGKEKSLGGGSSRFKGKVVAIGFKAGEYNQGDRSIAIGKYAGRYSQRTGNVAIGEYAGYTGQKDQATAIGYYAGKENQGLYATAIGGKAGNKNQGSYAIAIGNLAALQEQGAKSVAVGNDAGRKNQGDHSVAIGTQAGQNNQGRYAIAIGTRAGQKNQQANSIILNASSSVLNANEAGFFVNPIREKPEPDTDGTQPLCYNTTSKEITYSTTKTFVIDHPRDKDKYLVHACLEGAEAGVYYRGEGEIKTDEEYGKVEIELPSYVDSLATDFTVHLTPIWNGDFNRKIFCSKVKKGKFSVHGSAGSFNWIVHGKRQSIKTELNKDNVKINGSGPYKWIEY
jgi:hypothetical protein